MKWVRKQPVEISLAFVAPIDRAQICTSYQYSYRRNAFSKFVVLRHASCAFLSFPQVTGFAILLKDTAISNKPPNQA